MNLKNEMTKLKLIFSTLTQIGFWISVFGIFMYIYSLLGSYRAGKIGSVIIFAIGLIFDWLGEQPFAPAHGPHIKGVHRFFSRVRVSRWALLIGTAGLVFVEWYSGSCFGARFGMFALWIPIWAILMRIPFNEPGSAGKTFLSRWKIEIQIVGLTALVLVPILHGGYYWDDAINATIYGAEKIDGIPLLENVRIFMQRYLELGRVNLVSIYYYFFFYIRSIAAYKTLILIAVLLNQLAAAKLARYITGSKRVGQLVMILVLLSFQFRPYQDPLTGFYALMQLILLFLLGMVYGLIKYLRTGKKRAILFSLILWTLGLFTYEVTFPFMLMIPLLIAAETKSLKRVILVSLPFTVAFLAAVGAIFYVRTDLAVNAYPGVAFSLNDAEVIARTYLRQTVAALPLNFRTFAHEASVLGKVVPLRQLLNHTPLQIINSMSILDLGMIAIAAVLIFRIFSRLESERHPKSSGTLAVLGASLFLFSGVPIAVSRRYQGQLVPGLGYLPVYLGYYGFAILNAMIAGRVAARSRAHGYYDRWILKALTAVYCVTFGVILQDNRSVLTLLDQTFTDPYRPGRAALEIGIFDFLPDDALVLSLAPGEYLWEANWETETGSEPITAEFYSLYSGKDFLNQAKRAERFNADDPRYGINAAERAGNVYVFSYGGNASRGFAKLGRLIDVTENRSGESTILTDTVLYFIDGSYPNDASIAFSDADGNDERIEGDDLLRVRDTRSGTLYHFPKDELIRFRTLDLYGF